MKSDKEIKYLKILTGTREDYMEHEKKLLLSVKIASYLSAISLVLIPVSTFWNVLDGGAVMLLTAIIAFFEFYLKFNKVEQKLSLLNSAITNLNIEYYSYYYDCNEYSTKENDKRFQLFVEKTTTIIKTTELQLNNNLDMEALKNIEYTSKKTD